MKTVTTYSIFNNNCLMKLLCLLTLFIGRCQADQDRTVPISITVAVIFTLAAFIMVICACLRTQCACCQGLGRQNHHRIPPTADYQINVKSPHRKYHYGSDIDSKSYTNSKNGAQIVSQIL